MIYLLKYFFPVWFRAWKYIEVIRIKSSLITKIHWEYLSQNDFTGAENKSIGKSKVSLLFLNYLTGFICIGNFKWGFEKKLFEASESIDGWSWAHCQNCKWWICLESGKLFCSLPKNETWKHIHTLFKCFLHFFLWIQGTCLRWFWWKKNFQHFFLVRYVLDVIFTPAISKIIWHYLFTLWRVSMMNHYNGLLREKLSWD